MKNITKSGYIGIIATSLSFIGLIIIATFYDLDINKALYSPENPFARFFDLLGQLPSYIAAPFAGVILYHNDIGKTKKKITFFKLLSVAIIAIGCYMAVDWLWWGFVGENIAYPAIYITFFTIALTSAVFFGTIKLEKATAKKLLIFALFVLIVFAISNIIVQVMKIIWARQRFRTMVDIEKNAALLAAYGKDFEGFTAWYKPMTIFSMDLRTSEYVRLHLALDSDAFKSFPSGHVVAAAAAFGLILLPDIYENLKKHRWMFTTFPAIYVVLVAISRIMMGAHYLSDVVFGGYIGFAVAILARHIILRKVMKPKLQLTVNKGE
ncbi:MAG: phosphatase PAP2 family protein [Christensenellaceae bacterium]|jgi:membrane-associated phospholipid phosphatase|nr:phosphatase PAP2 family protein [Christensenellaceae bacterium]